MKNHRKINIAILSLFILFAFTSCLPGGENYSPGSPAGFLTGIWHGWMAPISLIISLFDESIRIYEPYNTGWWYDFGFYISIISGFGSIQFFRKKQN